MGSDESAKSDVGSKMDIEDVVKEYMLNNNFTGLYNPSMECGCRFSDLAPCDGFQKECAFGLVNWCKFCAGEEVCDVNTDDYDFMVRDVKCFKVRGDSSAGQP